MRDHYEVKINSMISYYVNYLFENPNVVGVGRGLKIMNGRWTRMPCLTIHVKEKIHKSNLNKRLILPNSIDGVATDVLESGELSFKYGKQRPVKGGISIGSYEGKTSGTVACGLTERGTEKGIYLLSCNHVLTRDGEGKIGDSILQPDISIDGKYPNDVIGKLYAIAPISNTVDPDKASEIDAAIAYVGENTKENQEKLFSPTLSDDQTLLKGYLKSNEIKLRDAIYKIGTRTGESKGSITSVNSIIKTRGQYATGKKTEVVLQNMIMSSVLSDEGDSGAICFKGRDFKAVGILVSGGKNVSAFCLMEKILDYFNMDLLKPK